MTPEQQALVTANLLLAYHLAGKAYRRAKAHDEAHGTTLDDLCQSAALALCRAARGFDTSKGFRFCTYATYVVENALKDALASERIVGFPRASKQRIRYSDTLASLIRPTDPPFGFDPASSECTPYSIAAEKDEWLFAETLLERLQKMLPRETIILQLRLQGYTYRQIGAQLGISRQGAHIGEQRALARLRYWVERAAG